MSPSHIDLREGDCIEVMKGLADNSIDAVVTDPPYHLTSIVKRFGGDNAAPAQHGTDGAFARASRGFMGKQWDGGDIAFRVELWSEVLRVLKPGCHVAAFSGTRTYHRMACAIEDAGFEIRDQLAWVYGSGFPKSHDVSKGIDKAAPRVGMFDGFARHYGDRRATTGLTHNQICEAGKFYAEHNHGGASSNWEKGFNVPTRAQWKILQPLLGLSGEWQTLIDRIEAEREKIGEGFSGIGTAIKDGQWSGAPGETFDITAPATDAAKQWQGWGTALKPAWEPICLARKPLSEPTIAANVLRWGTGAINVDACRVGTGENRLTLSGGMARKASPVYGAFANDEVTPLTTNVGRWPANLCHDGSQEVLDLFPETGSAKPARIGRKGGSDFFDGLNPEHVAAWPADAGGSAARFFYHAKASRHDRAGSKHPTIKPIKLMQWLCRLICPPGGTILDPFAGSGTTGAAAREEGFNAILIEREQEYIADIRRRLGESNQMIAAE